MGEIYIIENGIYLAIENGNIVLKRGGKIVKKSPLLNVDSIYVVSNISVSSKALKEFLKRGIEINFVSGGWKNSFRLGVSYGKNIFLRLKQYSAFMDEGKRLQIAKKIVESKIFNSISLLKNYYKGESKKLAVLKGFLKGLNDEKRLSLNELLGVEGIASKEYFSLLKPLFEYNGFVFNGRSRRPPRDEVNSMLSFGYTLLLSMIFGYVEGFGFDPYLGYLHLPDYGRPSLALDIEELFRSIIVDSLVIELVRKRIVQKEMFEKEKEGGYRFKREFIKRFVVHFRKKLERSFKICERSFSARDLIKKEISKLGLFLLGKAEYKPLLFDGRRDVSCSL